MLVLNEFKYTFCRNRRVFSKDLFEDPDPRLRLEET
jgi:hypothetical protein